MHSIRLFADQTVVRRANTGTGGHAGASHRTVAQNHWPGAQSLRQDVPAARAKVSHLGLGPCVQCTPTRVSQLAQVPY